MGGVVLEESKVMFSPSSSTNNEAVGLISVSHSFPTYSCRDKLCISLSFTRLIFLATAHISTSISFSNSLKISLSLSRFLSLSLSRTLGCISKSSEPS